MRRSVSIVSVGAIPASDRAAMYALYARHYDATDPDLFAADLGQKHHALLLRDEAGHVVGFTTMATAEMQHQGQRVRTVFSGDTIIDPAHWGHQELAFNWIAYAGSLKAEAPSVPLYWFLIVKGHRTYRYLSAFSIDFYPHWERHPGHWLRSLMARLGTERFGSAFDPESGVIRFTSSRGHLKPELAHIEETDARRPDVRLFLERNPGYREGHELLCLTELSQANLRPIARRQFAKGLAA